MKKLIFSFGILLCLSVLKIKPNFIPISKACSPEKIYKIIPAQDFKPNETLDCIKISPLDLKSGFMHTSFGNQVENTLKKFFQNIPYILILEIDPKILIDNGSELRVEQNNGTGDFYPHFYGTQKIPSAAILKIIRVKKQVGYEILRKRIENISKTLSPGYIGVAAKHIESKRHFEFNADLSFPMASTYKLPIAIYCLHLVDNKKLNLTNKIKVNQYNLRRGCHIKAGRSYSISKLIQLMIEKSDNAASDLILKTVGGPAVVTNWLIDNDFYKIKISRSVLKMIADYSGIKNLNDEYNCSINRDLMLLNSVSKRNRTTALKKFYNDKQDTTTPIDMVNLLDKFYSKKLISNNSTNFLLKSMGNLKWGKMRIPRLLPKNTKVWHKTGTMDSIISDAGIIELPGNKGHIAIAIFTNKSQKPHQSAAIARVSKLIFDYYRSTSI